MEVNVDLNTRPSRQFLVKLVQAILVYLLHERSQIPFSFEVFERFLSNRNNITNDEIKCYKTLKQVTTARETYDRICSFKQTIGSQFPCKSVVILFGSSLHSAKESYLINLPSTFIKDEFTPNYSNETAALRKALLEIITNERLKHTNQLPITNTFILFNRSERPKSDHPELSEIRNFRLNKACKQFILNLRDTSDFEIFQEEFEELSLGNEEKSPASSEVAADHWFQAKVFVKGFNDTLVNNRSIWN